MKFNFDINTIQSIVGARILGSQENRELNAVHYDTRLFDQGSNSLFLCLHAKRNGTSFIPLAYDQGCRVFMVQNEEQLTELAEVTYIVVPDVLKALQQLAQFHRNKFQIPVLGITGSFAKTIVKEWLYHFLKDAFHVIRSPKSFNSQLGVALSVLQMENEHNLAIFEAGISTKDEMLQLQEMIQPTLGVFTGLGTAHDDGFLDRDEKFKEKAILFKNVPIVVSENFQFDHADNRNWKEINLVDGQTGTEIHVPDYGVFETSFKSGHQLYNLCCVLETLKALNFPADLVQEGINSLPQIAMRMEVIQGKNNNIFVNDSYALDGVQEAVSFLHEMAANRDKLILIGLKNGENNQLLKEKIATACSNLNLFFVSEKSERQDVLSFEQAKKLLTQRSHTAVLIKGQYGSGISQLLAPFVLRSHPTVLEISRQALRKNLTRFKQCISPETKLMVMVKAAAYGVGAYEMASFLEKEGVDYLGVAFPDEGVNLRKLGLKLPIMVMNTPESAFFDIIENDLEPAIFSVQQLDAFVSELIRMGKSNYPIHVKLETGMNRLGFRENDLSELGVYLASQPEVLVKSVYSHLAESGNSDSAYTNQQLHRFDRGVELLKSFVPNHFFKHICNTDGIINYPMAHYDMVRLGIGLLGYAKLPGLEHALSLKTKISKINVIGPGESLGYDRSYVAPETKKIAVLPIGYADGYRRLFGNGVAFVYVANQKCLILGNVCMDMCFADVTQVPDLEDVSVELIGHHITVNDWAIWSQTIPYEVVTSLSSRITRIWIE